MKNTKIPYEILDEKVILIDLLISKCYKLSLKYNLSLTVFNDDNHCSITFGKLMYNYDKPNEFMIKLHKEMLRPNDNENDKKISLTLHYNESDIAKLVKRLIDSLDRINEELERIKNETNFK